jgi:hypothetical protein
MTFGAILTSVCCINDSADVLVIPTRVVARVADLTREEASSLFTSVQAVGKVIEKAYNADALTIACQVRPTVHLRRMRCDISTI